MFNNLNSNKTMTTNTLSFSTKEINRNFKIKVFGYNGDSKKINTLVGVSGLINLIGEEIADRLIARAFDHSVYEDATVCKLRRGLKVTFYNF